MEGWVSKCLTLEVRKQAGASARAERGRGAPLRCTPQYMAQDCIRLRYLMQFRRSGINADLNTHVPFLCWLLPNTCCLSFVGISSKQQWLQHALSRPSHAPKAWLPDASSLLEMLPDGSFRHQARPALSEMFVGRVARMAALWMSTSSSTCQQSRR